MTGKRITIAILALGGQGGGVLADWVLKLANDSGWLAQGTSVPGVAQRTGSTVYYIEMHPATRGPPPVFALMPVPGDVDVVIASELMEAGRAILRGLVDNGKTTLIASLHRIYAISEKIAMGDGAKSTDRIIDAARKRAQRFVGFDMDDVATQTGSVISSVMLGALAGSDALPFARQDFEAVIRSSGIAIDANLRGFAAGFDKAKSGLTMPETAVSSPPTPTTEAGRRLAARIVNELPSSARDWALHGVQRLKDYQDTDYASLYLDRLAGIAAVDGGERAHALTAAVARHLALWMAYDDIIRVADLKVRDSRFARVRAEVKAAPDQIIAVTEFMHPRLAEICDTMPAALGRFVRGSRVLSKMLGPLFGEGRHVETSSLRWFLALSALAGLRRWRRGTLRYAEEQARIEGWLATVNEAGKADPASARELALCQRLIKGYGDTFERGLRNFNAIMAVWRHAPAKEGMAATIAGLREAALADERGDAFAARLQRAAG